MYFCCYKIKGRIPYSAEDFTNLETPLKLEAKVLIGFDSLVMI